MHLVVVAVILVIFVVAVVGSIAFGRKVKADFERGLVEGGFRPAARTPIADPPWPDYKVGACYDGELRPGLPMTFMFVFRQKTVEAPWAQFVALYLPPHEALTDAWFDGWRTRVDAEQARAFPDFHRVERRPDGGVVIVRHGSRVRSHVDGLVDEVRRSLATAG